MSRLARGLSFSWSRFLGIAQAKARLSRRVGFPIFSRQARYRWVGRKILKAFGLCLLILAPEVARADDDGGSFVANLAFYGPINYADGLTTAKALRTGSSFESIPWLGHHPSNAKLAAWEGGTAIAFAGVDAHLSSKTYRVGMKVGFALVKGYFIARNWRNATR